MCEGEGMLLGDGGFEGVCCVGGKEKTVNFLSVSKVLRLNK